VAKGKVDGLTTGTQLRARVRSYKREGLLARLAAATSRAWAASDGSISPDMTVFPWGAAIVAREALLAPSNRAENPATPSDADVRALCTLAINLDDPVFHGTGGIDDLFSMSVRTAYEQFPYSTRGFNDNARTRPFFDQDFTDGTGTEMSNAKIAELLGGSVDVLFDSAPFCGASVWRNDGQFDEAWLHGESFAVLRERIDIEELCRCFGRRGLQR
jgi:hypothetical protein